MLVIKMFHKPVPRIKVEIIDIFMLAEFLLYWI